MGIFSGLFRKQRKVTDEIPTAQLPRAESSGITLKVGNLQGIGRREQQEDSFAIINASNPTEIERKGLFAVVCDGMGGMADGKSASEDAVGALCKSFQSLQEDEPISNQLADGIHTISDHIYCCYNGRSGTTAVAAYIHKNTLFWFSVGDSAIYLKRNSGVFQLNQEQTFLNTLYAEELQQEIINRQRAETHEDARRLTNFVGIDHLREPDKNTRPLPLKKGDVILLCSDGISGVLTPAELLEAMSLEPDAGCTLLETLVLEKDVLEQDNYTGIMISCK